MPAAAAFFWVEGAISHAIANIPNEPRMLRATVVLSMALKLVSQTVLRLSRGHAIKRITGLQVVWGSADTPSRSLGALDLKDWDSR